MTVRYTKDAATAQQPASTSKLITAIILRARISNLDTAVTVTYADIVGGSTANLIPGDVLTYRDLLFGMMLPSGNDAASCIGRTVGAVILASEGGSGDPLARFVTEMNSVASSYGMSTAVFYDPYGGNVLQRMSPTDLAILMQQYIQDDYLVTVSGTYQHTMTITGANARAYTVTHTINPNGTIKFPEFICGKTGTTDEAGSCLVMLWRAPSGAKRIAVVMQSATDLDRYKDMRRLIDYELARGA